MSALPAGADAGARFGAAEASGWTHSSLAVDDLDRSLAFYREAFGCEPVFEARDMRDLIERVVGQPGQGCDLAILRVPGAAQQLELIAFRDPAAAVAGRPPCGHVEFAVADLGRAVAAVERLGALPVGEVVDFPEGPSVYYREPGGSVVELTEYRP